jgi:hypothetical protein
MNLTSELEVANTRVKLADLESRYEELRREVWPDDRLRLITMRSLKKLINQFTEEIVRYQTRLPSNAQSAEPGERRPMQPSQHE